MNREVTATLIAFALTMALVPLIRRVCRRTQTLDRPGVLKIHAQPIPRLGGVAIFFGIFAGVIAFRPHNFAAHWQFFAAMSVIWFAGFVDDLRGLSPGLRLVAQVASGVFLWQGGWRLLPSGGSAGQFVLLCLFVILFANSFNFLDGSDGLATGVSCLIALAYLTLPRMALTSLGFSAALCISAACIAFLPFNRRRASIFLGDSGSTLLGFLAAFLGLDVANTPAAPRHSILWALAMAALPIYDALRVVVKRIARRRSPISGDRNHFYDSLLIRGWTPEAVALASWIVAAVCGTIAVCVVRLGASIAWTLMDFVIVALWIHLATAYQEKTPAANSETATMRSDCSAYVSGSKRSEARPQEGGEF